MNLIKGFAYINNIKLPNIMAEYKAPESDNGIKRILHSRLNNLNGLFVINLRLKVSQ